MSCENCNNDELIHLDVSRENDDKVCDDLDFIINTYICDLACDIKDWTLCSFADVIEMMSSILKNECGADKAMADMLCALLQRIISLENNVTNLTSGLQKILNNLYATGAITNNNIANYQFNSGRNIATGNINLYGQDNAHFIKCATSDTTENSLKGKL